MSDSFFMKRRTARQQRDQKKYSAEQSKSNITGKMLVNDENVNFNKGEEYDSVINDQTNAPDIPLILPQEPLTVTTSASTSSITIFGITNCRQVLLTELAQLGDISTLNHGLNFITFSFEIPEKNEIVLGWNRRMVEGEIIGVFSNRVEKGRTVKKGVLQRVWEYLFG